MNVGNILKVADAIEQASVPGLGFNMGVIRNDSTHETDMSGHACGTVACIAGWCLTIAGEKFHGSDVDADMATAALWLGLEYKHYDITGEATDLFMPPGYDTDIHTPQQAARCLRNLAITGKVDWEAAMKGDEPVLPPLPVSKALTRA